MQHRRIVIAHRVGQANDCAALFTQALAQLGFFPGGHGGIEPPDRLECVALDHEDAAARVDLPRRTIPFQIAQGVVNRSFGIAFMQPAADRNHLFVI